jgi:2-dehydropantoate 2-reductase
MPRAGESPADLHPQVCIVGPGALGCLHAALLSRAGVPVSLLDHRPDRADLINRRGLIVEDQDGSAVVPVRCSAVPSELPRPDLLILCVKTFQTAEAAAHAAPLVGGSTVVLRIQNGLGSPDCLLGLAPPERILLGTSGHGANTVAWGHLRRAGTGPTRLGPLRPEGLPAAEYAAELLRRALPDVEVSADVRSVLWHKLFVNTAINPLTALTGLRNGQLLAIPLLRAALRDLATEAEHVAIGEGLPFIGGQAGVSAEEACRLTAENRSSMLQDVHAGRRTEIDDICGAVVREAQTLGRHAPLNDVMTWLVAEVLSGKASKARGPM